MPVACFVGSTVWIRTEIALVKQHVNRKAAVDRVYSGYFTATDKLGR